MNRALAIRLFVVSTIATVGIRLAILGALDRSREIPLEADDAYSYLMHSNVIARDPRFEKSSLRSFAEVEFRLPQVTWEDFTRNRLHHRIKNFYHFGHAVMTEGLHRLGFSYERAWWFMAYALQFVLVGVAGALAWAWAGPWVAAWTIALYGFSYVTIHHHLTAAPREWANAGFLSLLWLAFRPRPKRPSALAAWAAWGGVSAFLCLTSHSIGPALAFQAAVLPALAWIAHRDAGRALRETGFVVGSLAAAWMAKLALMGYWGIPSFPATPLSVDLGRGFAETSQEFATRILDGTVQMTPLKYAWGKQPVITGAVAAVGLLAAVFLFFRDRAARGSGAFALALTAFGARFALGFVGQDFLPASKFYYFPEYYDTIFLFVLAFLAAHGFARLAAGRRARVGAVILLLFLAANALEKRSYSRGLVNYFATRGDLAASAGLIERSNDRFAASGKCVATCDETNLYLLLTHARLDFPIAYRASCGEKPVYEVGPARGDCAFAFYPKSASPEAFRGWRTVDENASFVVAERVR